MATRDVDEAEIISDKLAIMKDGKFVAVGSVGDIIKTHGNGYTLEIVPDNKHFNLLTPEMKWNDPTILESSEEAVAMLRRILQALNEKKEIIWEGLSAEF